MHPMMLSCQSRMLRWASVSEAKLLHMILMYAPDFQGKPGQRYLS
jgi:hypothetical protein